MPHASLCLSRSRSPARWAPRTYALPFLWLSLWLCACSGKDAKTIADAGSGPTGGDPTTDGGNPDLPPPVCGDGQADPETVEEACDDGNHEDGDGCSEDCEVEVGFLCPPKGGACTPDCGDGRLRGEEACDDGNQQAGDGCNQQCEVEPGYRCATANTPCVADRCGDGIVAGAETCDDGNRIPQDGCSDSCILEVGWLCIGESCRAAGCDDGIRAGDEQCDDGNHVSGDGCLADCSAREPFYYCPAAGGACSKLTVCGDGVFTADEQCDDGNLLDGDGCSRGCSVETGFICTGGTVCAARCGDGWVTGSEQCDDGGSCDDGSLLASCTTDAECDGGRCTPQPGDGCDGECQLEPGFKCESAGAPCEAALCGDGIREGLEQCDDGALAQDGITPVPDHQLGDGCTPLCTREPRCADGECQSTCGDGIVNGDEGCDDSNDAAHDGCSPDCEVEPGFICTDVEQAPPPCVSLPLILRDFKAAGLPDGHRDMETHTGAPVQDFLGFDLDHDGVADATPPARGAPAPLYNIEVDDQATSERIAAYNAWYHDGPLSKTIVGNMELCDDPSDSQDGVYIFDDYTFYPLDGQGWQDEARLAPGQTLEPSYQDNSLSSGCKAANPPADDPDMQQMHNFLFTSEVRLWFTYKGTERLTFTGDDDVHVFINGYRVVNLGGTHCALSRTVDLADYADPDQANLVIGRVYEAVVYQAERHTTMSTYHLELGNFLAKTSECRSVCGDGIRTAKEICDDGSRCIDGTHDGDRCVDDTECEGGRCASQNTGETTYGHCNSDCLGRTHFCGDGVLDDSESCDLGSSQNDGRYGGCNPDCSNAARCGDGIVDGFFGEECDVGKQNGEAGYGTCSAVCELGPHCGDGILQAEAGEDCDDGVNRSVYGGCAPGCIAAPRCGDGVVDNRSGETCDDGTANNRNQYGGCKADCQRAAYCGNGKVDGPEGTEECDDGNTNPFDGCSKTCRYESILE